ncbi:MAG: TlpA disulfide reductase family protein [Acidobacteriota bacterium]|nr:TlpA disulfide reductase family protein [Acidobacteriota bacterium]MDE3265600.1 TlpA disulfide reductase family protein [Acidobacteriota bacterium]
MTTWMETELGRWGKAGAVSAALAAVLWSGASQGSMALEESSVEDGMEALVAEVGPDWDVVEAYLEHERTWMARILASGKVSEDGSSPNLGEAGSATPRVFVVRASSDGAPPRAEMEQALRAALEAEDGVDVEQRLGAALEDLNGAELVDPRSEEPDSPASTLINDVLRAALEARPGAESADLPSEDGDSPASTDGSVPDAPDVRRAAAAAIAILKVGGTHEKTVEAAEFLVNNAAMTPGGEEYASRGARALLEYAPDYEGWGLILQRMHLLGRVGPARQAAAPAVFKVLASEAEDPVLRAAGRYYVAAGRMQFANAPGISEEDRAARRERALDAAAGLSAGVEEEDFPGDARTFAEAEADLIRSIRHGTVGSKVPDLAGSRLDGVPERLSDYRGRVVLLDFWATWCVPCVAALPEKRQLVADLPADRFALLSVSVDAELETVTGFMENEPMPWANWHIGMTSETTRVLNVVSYPTYILVDESGEILDRTNHLPDDFIALIEEAVGRSTE